MGLMGMIGELGELFDWFRASYAGWRYIFSSSFRVECHQKWRSESWLYIFFDALCGSLGIAFSILIVIGVFYFIAKL